MGGRAWVLYENICGVCNPGAEKKGNLEDVKTDVPTLYVGEKSRTIYEISSICSGSSVIIGTEIQFIVMNSSCNRLPLTESHVSIFNSLI